MGTFSSQFNDDDTRPECYGDPEQYDISTNECRQCRYKTTCRLKCQANERGRGSGSYSSTTSAPSTPSSTAVGYRHEKAKVVEDPREEDTFMSVLAHNAGLNAITSMSATLTEALSQIPRKKYPALKRRSTA